ncbi:MAG: hypothetical protein ACKOC5_00405 [Chloroflexota bacterium]
MHTETISFHGWPGCLRLANRQVELIAAGAFGPRLLHFALPGADNLLHIFPETAGRAGGADWLPYGGHRLWHAPEARPRSYSPDNDPLDWFEQDGRLHLVQPVEPGTGIQKSLQVWLDEARPAATLVHRLANTGAWTVELAAWAITQVRLGGTAVLPLPGGDGLLPVTQLALWPYTDLADPRLRFARQALLVDQTTEQQPTKVGVYHPLGAAGYYCAGQLFVKRVLPDGAPGANTLPGGAPIYPDRGCNLEVFTRFDMLEL